MSAPARGLVLRPLCRQKPVQAYILGRAFASIPPRQAVAQPVAKPKRPPPPGARPIPVSSALVKNPILLQLARSPGATLLYESGSHFWMKLSAWSTASICYVGAGVNFVLATSPGEGLAWFISPIYAVTSLALAGMGSFFVFGAASIVKSVRAVPTALIKDPLSSAINPQLTPIHLEIAIKPLTPFRTRTKVLTVLPDQVTLARPLYNPSPSAQQLRNLEARANQAKKAQWEKDKQRLMTLPFRDAWRYSKMAFQGVKRALTGGGFVKMTIDTAGTRKCKLDMATGWALNDGQTLEAVVKVDRPSNLGSRRR